MDEDIDQIEAERRENPIIVDLSEFRECIPDLLTKKDELRLELNKLNNFYTNKKLSIRRNKSYDIATKKFLIDVINIVYISRIVEPLEAELKRIEDSIKVLSGKKFKTDKKDLAKSVPIKDILIKLGVKITGESKDKIYAYSPFKNEKSPSFVAYKNDNTYHCFSTGNSGDAIDLVCKVKQSNFISAINFITNHDNSTI